MTTLVLLDNVNMDVFKIMKSRCSKRFQNLNIKIPVKKVRKELTIAKMRWLSCKDRVLRSLLRGRQNISERDSVQWLEGNTTDISKTIWSTSYQIKLIFGH